MLVVEHPVSQIFSNISAVLDTPTPERLCKTQGWASELCLLGIVPMSRKPSRHTHTHNFLDLLGAHHDGNVNWASENKVHKAKASSSQLDRIASAWQSCRWMTCSTSLEVTGPDCCAFSCAVRFVDYIVTTPLVEAL